MINVYCVFEAVHRDALIVINEQIDMNIVGYQDYFPSIEEQIKLANADMVLIDLDTVTMNLAFELIKELTDTNIPVIGITKFAANPNLVTLIDAGIGSLVLKTDKEIQNIPLKIREIREGCYFIPPDLKPLFYIAFSEQEAINIETFRHDLHKRNVYFTRRELEIAYLIKKGIKNKPIASILGITEGTVKVHITQIYNKLGINKRKEVVKLLNGILREVKIMNEQTS